MSYSVMHVYHVDADPFPSILGPIEDILGYIALMNMEHPSNILLTITCSTSSEKNINHDA